MKSFKTMKMQVIHLKVSMLKTMVCFDLTSPSKVLFLNREIFIVHTL